MPFLKLIGKFKGNRSIYPSTRLASQAFMPGMVCRRKLFLGYLLKQLGPSNGWRWNTIKGIAKRIIKKRTKKHRHCKYLHLRKNILFKHCSILPLQNENEPFSASAVFVFPILFAPCIVQLITLNFTQGTPFAAPYMKLAVFIYAIVNWHSL